MCLVAFDGAFYCSVPPLKLAGGNRIVAGGPDSFAADHFCQCPEQMGLELGASVRGDGDWRTEPGDPRLEEGVDDGVGADVFDRGCFWPPGEPVNHRETIPVTLGYCQWFHDV